jgi:hypothetical protein
VPPQSGHSTLGEIGHRLGRKAPDEVANVARPDTTLAWYRKLALQVGWLEGSSEPHPASDSSIFGGQIFDARHQLLVHHPSDESQNAPISSVLHERVEKAVVEALRSDKRRL